MRPVYHESLILFSLPAPMKSLMLRLAFVALTGVLAACSPHFDWREIHGESAAYVIAMPAKPATFTRNIDLNGLPVAMTMTAAEVDGITFAVGSAELPDAMQAQVSLAAMKTAMVNNIRGTVRQEKVSTMQRMLNGETGTLAVTEIEARGAADRATVNQPRILFGRFVANNRRVYQLIVTGAEKDVPREAVATFFSSFRFN